MLRHKLIADGVAVGLDVVGVIAGGFLVVAAAPELLGGAVVIGTAGIITGGMAAVGSFILLTIDGTIFAAEYQGDEARAERIEGNHTVQWLRVTATLMLLPDLPIGGIRALREVGVLGREATEARATARMMEARSLAQRERAAKIHNPAKHPGPVNRHLARANRAAKVVAAQQAQAARLTNRIRWVKARDVDASFAATPGSAALLAGLPPAVLEGRTDLQRDKELLESLAPEHGMPRDVRLELRMTGIASYAGRH